MKYIYFSWQNTLSNKEIKEINSICNKHIDSGYKDEPATGVTKTAKVDHIAWKWLKPKLNLIYEKWMAVNRDSFGYNLYPLQNLNPWNLNVYKSKDSGEYGYHLDEDNKHFSDIKLTGIINISDEPYQGGEFMAFYNNDFRVVHEIFEPGSALLMKYGTLHKVCPVTDGVRKTLSFWFYGPPFV